jgi:hypothetical protein
MNPAVLALRVFGLATVIVLVAAFGFALLLGVVIAFAIAFGRRFAATTIATPGRI